MNKYIIEQFLKLQEAQKNEFPGYVFVPLTTLMEEFRLNGEPVTAGNIAAYDKDMSGVLLGYILSPNEYGASLDHCCVGLRYGDDPSEYISLPNLPASVFNKIILNQEAIKQSMGF